MIGLQRIERSGLFGIWCRHHDHDHHRRGGRHDDRGADVVVDSGVISFCPKFGGKLAGGALSSPRKTPWSAFTFHAATGATSR